MIQKDRMGWGGRWERVFFQFKVIKLIEKKKWEEMYNLNQENKAFGQFGWNGKFPEGRTDKKKSLKN